MGRDGNATLMADLGAIGKDQLVNNRLGVQIIYWRPVGGIRVIPGKATIDMVPLFNRVTSPVQVADTYALECYTSGTFAFQVPVDAGFTYTASVYLRKSSGYVSSIQGFRASPLNLLPYLQATRQSPSGLYNLASYTDTMADVTDTWDQVSVDVPVLEKAVLLVDVVIPGLGGTSGFFYGNRSDLETRFVTKCWVNYLDITAVQT
jgi:hypothetical protein